MPLDSLDVMEQAMRHFYFRAKIEKRLGDRTDWQRVDDAFMRAVQAPAASAIRRSRLRGIAPRGI